MLAWYKKCIFCGRPLPNPDQRGRGDHIIPEFLGGSITTKDVCSNTRIAKKSCNSRFGSEVDHLILQDARVIDAVMKLDLPELKDMIYERSTIIGKDINDGHQLQFKHKGKRAKLVPSPIMPDGMEYPEEDALGHMMRDFARNCPLGMSSDDAKEYIRSMVWPEYQKLEPGQEAEFPAIGLIVRKRTARVVEAKPKTSPSAANRLIAKVVYEMCHCALCMDDISKVWEDLSYFGRLAFGETAYTEYSIFYRNDRTRPDPSYMHLITLYYDISSVIIDIDLFRSVNYRVMLRANDRLQDYTHEGKRITATGLGMGFFPGKPIEKRICYLPEHHSVWEEYIMPDL